MNLEVLFELILLFRILLAAALGGLIGHERERVHKPAGLRTHMLVCMGSCLFTILSIHGFPDSDPARIASYVVAGIGFIGAGAIIHERDQVRGITTAASLWVAASIGMTLGSGYFLLATATAVIAYIILQLRRVETRSKR